MVDGIVEDGTRVDGATDAVESPAMGSGDGGDDGSLVGRMEGSSVLEVGKGDDNEGWVGVPSKIVEIDEGSTVERTER